MITTDEECRAALSQAGISWRECNDGSHWRIEGGWNFWPRRQKWYNDLTHKRGIGIKKLIELIVEARRKKRATRSIAVVNDTIETPPWDTPDPCESYNNALAIYDLFVAVVQSDEFRSVVVSAIGQALQKQSQGGVDA